MNNLEKLQKIARLIRYYSLVSTTEAGSGHPTSSLSAADLMTGLLFSGIFRYDLRSPEHPNNDRLLFSKGHASPLFYSLWAAAGRVSEEELMSLRKFDSPLEGHPTAGFRYAEAATGSLGQGLSIGLGIALNGQYLDKLPYRTYVLMGDSEMAEGSLWEALEIGAYYKLNQLIGILDVNRLGQRGETMYGHDLTAYRDRVASFGWETILIDGHDFEPILSAYKQALESKEKPVMIIARTIKGKGVSFIEDKNGWHGKTLTKNGTGTGPQRTGRGGQDHRGGNRQTGRPGAGPRDFPGNRRSPLPDRYAHSHTEGLRASLEADFPSLSEYGCPRRRGQ